MSMLHGTRRALLGGGLKPFNFNPRLCTFTAGMAKRAGTVFAGAPIIQGNWDGSGTPDVLSFGRGTQVSGHWYDNFDAYQGGGFCTWYPEQSSADRATNAYLWHAGGVRLYYDYAASRYVFVTGGQQMLVPATVTAGTPEYLAWGFDTNNDLDGTNYAYFSRNNAQTYGITVQPTAAAPSATIYVGSVTVGPANGILESLVFVREIPWNGNFGTDMGQGDIVAAHAAGNDVALSIASWGTTWSMPTDSTPGALVTGTGEAWSHPHRTNLLGVGAFMMDGTYTNDGWADEGTPTAVAALAAAEKIGPGGYKVTSDAANEGIYKDITVTPGDDVVIRVSGYSDGTSVPKVILYDQIGGAEIGSLTGSNASTRAAPDVFLFTGEAPAGCTTIRVKLINTDATAAHITYWNEAPVYVNLITNPSLEGAYAGVPPIPPGWTDQGLDAGDTQASSTGGAVIHSGAEALQWNVGAVAGERIYTPSITNADGDFIALGIWAYGDGSIGVKLADISAQYLKNQYDGNNLGLITATAAAWAHNTIVCRLNGGASWRLGIGDQSGASAARYTDDIYAIALDAVSVTCTPADLANSTENGALRVDGDDECEPDTIANKLKSSKGEMRITVTPRHDAAQWAGFGNAAEYDLDLYQDANNYIRVSRTANTVTLAFNAKGAGEQSDTYDATAAWNAATDKLLKAGWTSSGAYLYIAGVKEVTISAACTFAADFAASDVHVGSRQDGTLQGDATYGSP